MYTPIKLDKIRNFRYGMLAISRIEKVLKKPIRKLDVDYLTMEEISVIMWAGLVHEDPQLEPEKIMLLIDEYSNVKAAIETMWEAFNQAFGGDKEEKK